VWTIGCPAEIRPFVEEKGTVAISTGSDGDDTTGPYYKQAFQELFPDLPVPPVVGSSCCAQFAVTRERIKERPKADYERYREWLLASEAKDDICGRVFEYTWHSKYSDQGQVCIANLAVGSHLREGSCALSKRRRVLLQDLRLVSFAMRRREHMQITVHSTEVLHAARWLARPWLGW